MEQEFGGAPMNDQQLKGTFLLISFKVRVLNF